MSIGLPGGANGKKTKKNSPGNAGGIRDAGSILEEPMEKEMATHSSILA